MKAHLPRPGAQGARQQHDTTNWDPYAVWLTRVKDGRQTASEPPSDGDWDPYEVWRTQIRRR